MRTLIAQFNKTTMLVMIVALCGCASTEENQRRVVAPDPANWAADFYWASAAVRGSRYCDPDFGKELASRFDRRFGSRFRRLNEDYTKRFGEPKEFIIVGGCRMSKGKEQRARIRHRKNMTWFADWIAMAEQQVAIQKDQ